MTTLGNIYANCWLCRTALHKWGHASLYYVVGVNFNWVVKNVNGSWYKVCRRWKKNEMRDSFHICLIFLLAGCLLPCLDFCDNGVLRSDKAKIRQISPSSLFFDVSICTLSRQRYPIQKSKKSKCYFFLTHSVWQI